MSFVLEPKVSVQIAQPSRHLHGPFADGLLLGGASVIAFILVRLVDMSSAQAAILAMWMLILANFINHPHFAHSYQLFYSLSSLVSDKSLPRSYRRRWITAAYWVPAALILFIAFGVIKWMQGDKAWLAALINVMGALVGWHYVKQGFGMAMLDASIKRRFWSPFTRRALLANAYACWIAAWALANSGPIGAAFWGVFRLEVQVPFALVVLLCMVAATTTIWCLFRIANSVTTWLAAGLGWAETPLNGLVAYLVTLYLWILFAWADPTYALVIPFFHSLQYLTVIWRYKLNETAEDLSRRKSRLIKFGVIGALTGAMGFWIAPGVVDYVITNQVPMQSNGVFVAIACAWLFINIHHYFIDSVIWRKENPLTRKYLFG